jgi:hypothetical protein
MILTRCPGDRAVAARAIAAASNAVAENAKHTQRQRLPSIRATMRPVRRRPGMTSTRTIRQQRKPAILLTILRGVDQRPSAHANL